MELLLIIFVITLLIFFLLGRQVLKAILFATFILTLGVVLLYLCFKFLLLFFSFMPFVFLIVAGIVIGILISSNFKEFLQRKLSSML